MGHRIVNGRRVPPEFAADHGDGGGHEPAARVLARREFPGKVFGLGRVSEAPSHPGLGALGTLEAEREEVRVGLEARLGRVRRVGHIADDRNGFASDLI